MSETTNILFLGASSNPDLKPGDEFARVRRALEAGHYRDYFSICSEWVNADDDLYQVLTRRTFDVLHISAHATDSGELYVPGAEGPAARIEVERLLTAVAQLRGSRLRCLYFNVCWGYEQLHALSNAVDLLVAPEGEISDRWAIDSAASFYAAIANGESVSRAIDIANNHARDFKLRSFAAARGHDSSVFLHRIDNMGVENRLYDLFIELFERPGELEVYLRTLADWRTLGPLLPSDLRPWNEIASGTASLLVREKSLNQAWFDRLSQQRPGRRDEIQAVARAWRSQGARQG